MFDFGIIYKGYRSDMTRTMIIGQRTSSFMKTLYSTVKRAQKIGIKKARPGTKISDCVKSVHGYMRQKGMGRYIAHSLGHGLGKKIHESPKLSEKNNRVFQENMVVTIEPGLYVKTKGGVRIEDAVLITKQGARVLYL